MGKEMKNNGMFGGVYFLTIIGAAIYFIQRSEGFWYGVLGFLKALIWPLFVTCKILELLKL
jgi:hypothetical protein